MDTTRNTPAFSQGLVEFRKSIAELHACIEHIVAIRWPSGFSCEKCGGSAYHLIPDSHRLRCQKCFHRVSLTANSLIDKTHIPLQEWLCASHLLVSRVPGLTAKELESEIGVPCRSTANRMLERMRLVFRREQLNALNGAVEIGYFLSNFSQYEAGSNVVPKAPLLVVGIVGGNGDSSSDGVEFRVEAFSPSDHASIRSFCELHGRADASAKIVRYVDSFPPTSELNHEIVGSGERVRALLLALGVSLRGERPGHPNSHAVDLNEFAFRVNANHRPEVMFPRLVRALTTPLENTL